MYGLNELGNKYDISFKRPIGLDEGVAKVVKIG